MKITFQADEDLNQNIVNAVLRINSEINFRTAMEANLKGLKDAQVLALCEADKRVLVSHDYRTMPNHFADRVKQSQSYGVLIVPKKLPIIDVAENIVLIWEVFEVKEWINRIVFLPF